MGETKMIGIDFTWIDLNGKLTNSLEVFTCDLLDCIADQNEQKNFVIITHCIWHISTADFAEQNGRNAKLNGRLPLIISKRLNFSHSKNYPATFQ